MTSEGRVATADRLCVVCHREVIDPAHAQARQCCQCTHGTGRVASSWCEVDGCPASVCGGPHREIVTTFGTEILRLDQEPVGACDV